MPGFGLFLDRLGTLLWVMGPWRTPAGGWRGASKGKEHIVRRRKIGVILKNEGIEKYKKTIRKLARKNFRRRTMCASPVGEPRPFPFFLHAGVKHWRAGALRVYSSRGVFDGLWTLVAWEMSQIGRSSKFGRNSIEIVPNSTKLWRFRPNR